MSEIPPDTRPRIELLIREGIQPALQEQVDRHCERAGALVQLGAASTVETSVWGTHIPIDDGVDTGCAERERYADYREWADGAGVELDPAFSTHRTHSLVSDRHYRVVTVPCVTMALYDEDRLVGVYPHRQGETVRTVADGIAALSPEFEPLETDRNLPVDGERATDAVARTPEEERRDTIELEPRGE